jgi:peroxiredoxin Q/BCP
MGPVSGWFLLVSLKPWRTEEMAEETKPPVVLAPGSPAPHFSLPGRSGNAVSLSDFAGKNAVLVYFYPKDDTPGCTKEACSLRDGWGALQAAGVTVLGISRDGAESHAAFASKYDLPFELLTDADHSVHEAYGAWGQNPNPIWGVGPLRKSFLVGKDGNLLHVFDKVDTERHADQVLKAMGAGSPADVGGAMKGMVEAVKKVAVEVRKTETVKKAEKAVRQAETAVSNAVEEVSQKPAMQKAAKAVKKAVADAKKKPAVKKATKAVKKAVADVKAGVKAGVKNVKEAIATARKKGPAKVAKAAKAVKGKKAPAKRAAKVAKKAARKPEKKAVKKAVKKTVTRKAKPAPKKAKPAPKKKAAKGKGRR